MSFKSQYMNIEQFMPNIKESHVNKINTSQHIKKEKVNNFPMAWTCYKDKQGNFICPLRGDKPILYK
tara:strand:+ start:968 stop:1168 length:201 start_codon:yes stop_codon:yes gene_type:complete